MNVNVTKIDRLSNGMVQFYNGSDVVDSFSITSSVSVGFENNTPKTIIFSNSVKTLSFNVFNVIALYGATSNKIYSSGVDPSDTSTAYISRLYDIYAFLISDVIQGCCPGPTFVGGVVAAYPDYFSFPAVGTPSVIYIDESTGIAYYWDAGAYHELVSGTAPTPLGYYGAWQDDVTQTVAVSNVGYPMIFRTIDLVNGIAVVTNGTDLTRITFAHTGVYNLQFSSQFQNIDNQEHDVTIWLRLNGVDVPGSSGFIGVPSKHGSVNGHCVVSWNYLLDVVGGQYYELVWSTTSAANVTMQFYAAGSPPPSAASVILTVTQQAGILAGTGITAINSLTGDIQTLATGTSGTDFGISSATSTHTFNLPTASAANRGALSSADWSTFNGKFTLPSLTSGSVLFSNGTTIAQDNANLFWDDTNNRLGIGTASPSANLSVRNSAGSYAAVFGGQSATPSWVSIGTVDSGNSPFIQALNNTLSGTAKLCLNVSGGNVLIGTTTDAGYRLDVNGTSRFQGNISQGSGHSILSLGNNVNLRTFLAGGSGYVVNAQSYNTLNSSSNEQGFGEFTGTYAPTSVSGTPSFNALKLTPTINQTGSANQITRGLFINPTLTSAADFRAIETTVGKVCLNTTSGNTLIGTTTDAGFKLDVVGSVRTTGSISAASAIARGTFLNQTLVATANSDSLAGLEINPTFTNGAFTGVKNNWINLVGNASVNFTNQLYLKRGDVDVLFASSVETQLKTVSSSSPLKFFVGSTSQYAQFFATTGNLSLQNGGTFTDVASSRLTINSTTQGFLPPRMTTTQKNAIASPATGLMVYDTTLNLISVYNGTIWISL